MVIFIVRAVPHQVRGTLSKWFIEPAPGVFVGSVSARVRDGIWDLLLGDKDSGSCTLLHPADNEAGFVVRTHGVADRRVADFDGLQLIARKFQRYSSLTTELSKA